MTDIHTTTLSLALQAAREVVAAKYDYCMLMPDYAASVRRGERDGTARVDAVLAIARATHAAVLEAVVRACAGVARAEGERLAEASRRAAAKPGVFGNLERDRRLQSLAAGEIEQSILALIGEDSVSLSPAGRMVAVFHDLNRTVEAEILALTGEPE